MNRKKHKHHSDQEILDMLHSSDLIDIFHDGKSIITTPEQSRMSSLLTRSWEEGI